MTQIDKIKELKNVEEHIIPEDDSTTIISRPCSGCGKHQTIAVALLNSKYWKDWYNYASENMLYDVDETFTIDAMSDNHFDDFIKFIISQHNELLIKKIEEKKEEYIPNENTTGFNIEECQNYRYGYKDGIDKIITLIKNSK